VRDNTVGGTEFPAKVPKANADRHRHHHSSWLLPLKHTHRLQARTIGELSQKQLGEAEALTVDAKMPTGDAKMLTEAIKLHQSVHADQVNLAIFLTISRLLKSHFERKVVALCAIGGLSLHSNLVVDERSMDFNVLFVLLLEGRLFCTTTIPV
jgi:hypothetical protein